MRFQSRELDMLLVRINFSLWHKHLEIDEQSANMFFFVFEEEEEEKKRMLYFFSTSSALIFTQKNILRSANPLLHIFLREKKTPVIYLTDARVLKGNSLFFFYIL